MNDAASALPSSTIDRFADSTTRRWLVFTSAGKKNNIDCWFAGARDRQWDLWLHWYDETGQEFPAEYLSHGPGGKFPHLQSILRRHPELYDRYDGVFVVDDDIQITGGRINQLFQVLDAHQLWMVAPSHLPSGIISFPQAMPRRHFVLRYVNLLEVNTPVFRSDVLKSFMKIYDPHLIGYGVDGWYSTGVCGPRCKVAIADCVPMLNPDDTHLPGREREIDNLQSAKKRLEMARVFSKEIGFPIPARVIDWGGIRAPRRWKLSSSATYSPPEGIEYVGLSDVDVPYDYRAVFDSDRLPIEFPESIGD